MEFINELCKFLYDGETYNGYTLVPEHYYGVLKQGLDTYSVDILLDSNTEVLKKLEQLLLRKRDEITNDGRLDLELCCERLREDGLSNTDDYKEANTLLQMRNTQLYFIDETLKLIRRQLCYSGTLQEQTKEEDQLNLRAELDKITPLPYLSKEEMCKWLGITENTFNLNYRNRCVEGKSISGKGKTLYYYKEDILKAKKEGKLK